MSADAAVVRCRGVRGATFIDEDTPEAILAGTRELVAAIARANGIAAEDIASAFFTSTADLRSAFPTRAARDLGWTVVPLLGATEVDKPGAPPATVLAATAGQFLLLPVIGWLLIRSLRLQPAIAQGVLLVAACPSGATANVYAYLARGNVAPSLTPTAGARLAAVLAPPPALAALQTQTPESTGARVPYGVPAGQLVLLLVLPARSCMGTRRRWPEITRRRGRTLLGLGNQPQAQ